MNEWRILLNLLDYELQRQELEIQNLKGRLNSIFDCQDKKCYLCKDCIRHSDLYYRIKDKQ